jgi:hypothetical protein
MVDYNEKKIIGQVASASSSSSSVYRDVNSLDSFAHADNKPKPAAVEKMVADLNEQYVVANNSSLCFTLLLMMPNNL